MRVADMLGNILINESVVSAEGENQKQLDLSVLAKGVYFFSLIQEGVEVKTIRVAVQ
ncbi:MAG: T9SS type A sorting domain-containing protein [Bacteroidetes bacterium]|nr:T9SS type A sorting domain-containing protein [Bacteroidota bacterium]